MKHMHYSFPKRTDIWREGTWIDLWSVVHFLSGVLLGYGLFLLHLGSLASVLLTFLLLVLYEMWEMLMKIQETGPNRFMDVVIGIAGFASAFFVVCPALSPQAFIVSLAIVLSINIGMSVIGWKASQKAEKLRKRLLLRYAAERELLRKEEKRIADAFQRK